MKTYLQHIFNGHSLPSSAYCPHSAFALQLLQHTSLGECLSVPQKSGPNPHQPDLAQHAPLEHGMDSEQEPSSELSSWIVAEATQVPVPCLSLAAKSSCVSKRPVCAEQVESNEPDVGIFEGVSLGYAFENGMRRSSRVIQRNIIVAVAEWSYE